MVLIEMNRFLYFLSVYLLYLNMRFFVCLVNFCMLYKYRTDEAQREFIKQRGANRENICRLDIFIVEFVTHN